MRTNNVMIIAFTLLALVSLNSCSNSFQDEQLMEEYKTNFVKKLMETREKNANEKLIENYRSNVRKWVVGNAQQCPASNFLAFREYVEDIDDPKGFFCDSFVTKLGDLPRSAEIPKPWSAHYWAIKTGGLSYRYSPFNRTKNISTWKGYVNIYHQPEDHNKYYNSTEFDYVVNKMYSPSEKYDLLVGDYNYTLTNKMKDEGNHVVKGSDGDIPGWYGKCHGWTPASINEPRPVHTVNITAADNKTVISFYPEDIKGLATVFWAEAKYETKFLGSRCPYQNYSKIPHDEETGLWDEYRCFTVNPATLVLILSNQLGIRNKSLVYDPDSTGEIWNQPVYGYNLSFFNPLSLAEGSIEESKVNYTALEQNNSTNVTEFIERAYLNFSMIKNFPALFNYLVKNASPKAKNVIGVTMTVSFIFENPPVFNETQLPDKTDKRRYTFFLELDGEDNVIGGEWVVNKHPIFIWNPAEGAQINGVGDDEVTEFNGTVEELQKISESALKASRRNTVLKAVMKYFVKQSSRVIPTPEPTPEPTPVHEFMTFIE
jgi:hypothetical protein